MKPQKFKITTNAYQDIVKKIGSNAPEKGGILMGSSDGIVTDFIFDKDAETSGSTYSLNVAYLNPFIKQMKEQGKELLGIVHSHPHGYSKLSGPDREYFSGIFKSTPELEFLYTPIVFSAKQQEFHLFPYIFYRDGSIEEAELEILPNDYQKYSAVEECGQKNREDAQKIEGGGKKQSPEQEGSHHSNPNSCAGANTCHFHHPAPAQQKKPFKKKSVKRKLFIMMVQEKPEAQAHKNGGTTLSKASMLVLAITSIYFFLLGICAGAFPAVLLYIANHKENVAKLRQPVPQIQNPKELTNLKGDIKIINK